MGYHQLPPAGRMANQATRFRLSGTANRRSASPAWHPSFSLRQRLCDFTGAVNEKLRDGAERAVLQGDDYVLHVGHLQFNGQDLDLRAHGGKSQYGSLVTCARTLSFDPWNGLAWYHIGLAQIQLGRFEDALTTFKQADRFDTPQVSRWTWLLGAGWAYMLMGRSEAAYDALRIYPQTLVELLQEMATGK